MSAQSTGATPFKHKTAAQLAIHQHSCTVQSALHLQILPCLLSPLLQHLLSTKLLHNWLYTSILALSSLHFTCLHFTCKNCCTIGYTPAFLHCPVLHFSSANLTTPPPPPHQLCNITAAHKSCSIICAFFEDHLCTCLTCSHADCSVFGAG